MIKKIQLLNEDDFKPFVNRISRDIALKYTTAINDYKLRPPLKTDGSLIIALKQQRIIYDERTECFKGKITTTIKKILLSLGAVYYKGGYKIKKNNLPFNVKNTINSIQQHRITVSNLIQDKIKTLDSDNLLSISSVVLLKKLTNSLNNRVEKNLSSTSISAISAEDLKTLIIDNVKNTIKREYNVLSSKIIEPNVKINKEIVKRKDKLSISVFDSIGYSVRLKLYDEQQKICKKEYKTTHFYLIHRDPPQPQDRPNHIRLWRNKIKLDFNKTYINPYSGKEDKLCLEPNCHCRMEVIVYGE